MPEAFSSSDINEGKMFAVLSYLSFCCILPLILKKNNAFVCHHARQALVLFVIQVALFILSILIPMGIIKIALFLNFSLAFWGLIKALMGQGIALPVIYELSRKIQI